MSNSRKPKKADLYYVARLLKERSLIPEIPEEIAKTMVKWLSKIGFFTFSGGHYDLAAKPGTTMMFPLEAVHELWRALCHFQFDEKVQEIVFEWIQGTGMSGSGATGIDTSCVSTRASHNYSPSLKTIDDVERLKWYRDEYVMAFGGGKVAEQLVDFAIEQWEKEAQGASGEQESRLTPTEQSILKYLQENPNKRQLTSEIAKGINRKESHIGKYLKNLTELGLIENKPRKGYRLTDKGKSYSP